MYMRKPCREFAFAAEFSRSLYRWGMKLWICLTLLAGIAGAENLGSQLAKWKAIRMPVPAGLAERERRLLGKLVEASQALETVYWQQADPEGLRLMQSTSDEPLRRFLRINGARWDLLAENAPFGGAGPIPPGRSLYPAGWSRERIEAWVKTHPDRRGDLYSPYAVVVDRGGDLDTIRYSKAYEAPLQNAANSLRAAADLSDDPAFARFLRLRADALLKDDYFESDLAWMDLKNPKFDVIFGPYETYLDEVLAVKTSFASAILVRNDTESRRLEMYQRYVPRIQDALPLNPADRPSKQGHVTPMEVMDSPFRTGDLTHGYQAVADNLPNDPRIHARKGSKKIFFKNFMDARVNLVILPLARQLMRPDQARMASGEGYMAGTVLHEIAHGLGPDYARVDGKQIEINAAIGPIYSALEEAKADAAGMFGLQWLMDHGALPKSRAAEYWTSYMAGLLRSVRYGVAEAHGRAEMMQFNFMLEQGAFARENGRYAVHFERVPAAVTALAKELLAIEATGDRVRAERWFAKYDRMPQELADALAQVKDVPVDVDPEFDFPLLAGN